MKQRGLNLNELDLIMRVAAEVEGGFFVRDKDVADIERTLKRVIERLRKLKGKRLVVEGNTLITAYHANHRDERRLMRRG
jgi:hypothetical protein